jgi:hypothetical protein
MFQLGITVLAYVLGKRDITVWPVMTYIYLFVCKGMQSLYSLFSNPSFCNSAQSELKCKTGTKKPLTLAFYHIKTGGA